jgi:hypothetical protein
MDVNSSGYGWFEPCLPKIRTEPKCAQIGSIGRRISHKIRLYRLNERNTCFPERGHVGEGMGFERFIQENTD